VKTSAPVEKAEERVRGAQEVELIVARLASSEVGRELATRASGEEGSKAEDVAALRSTLSAERSRRPLKWRRETHRSTALILGGSSTRNSSAGGSGGRPSSSALAASSAALSSGFCSGCSPALKAARRSA